MTTPPSAALDACCLINLLAAGTDPLASGADHPRGVMLCVPALVADREVLRVLRPDEEGRPALHAVDLGPYLKSGALRKCDLEGERELELFVSLAAELDDGEAACLAIAASRGWLLATDDRKARRLAEGLGVKVITTPELLRNWAERTRAPREQVAATLRDIERFARFVPAVGAPDYAWWMEHVGARG